MITKHFIIFQRKMDKSSAKEEGEYVEGPWKSEGASLEEEVMFIEEKPSIKPEDKKIEQFSSNELRLMDQVSR